MIIGSIGALLLSIGVALYPLLAPVPRFLISSGLWLVLVSILFLLHDIKRK